MKKRIMPATLLACALAMALVDCGGERAAIAPAAPRASLSEAEQPKEEPATSAPQASTAAPIASPTSTPPPAVPTPKAQQAEANAEPPHASTPPKPASAPQGAPAKKPKPAEPQQAAPKMTQTVTASEPSSWEPSPTPNRETEPTPEMEPTQLPEPTHEAAFDIGYWIAFAQQYADNVGLQLDGEAIHCWDNPITAGKHSIYLERDIQSRLNRYSRDEDITAVWVWAQPRDDGSYDLYIGYA